MFFLDGVQSVLCDITHVQENLYSFIKLFLLFISVTF